MAIIANAEVKTCVEAWSGEVSSGRHQFITDKPASFGGQDKGPAPYDFILDKNHLLPQRIYK